MANPNFKGRPKGSGKSTFIEDPLLGDFKIAIDEYSFNVVDTKKNKTLGFHTSLPQAILSIAKYQMLKEKTFKLTEAGANISYVKNNEDKIQKYSSNGVKDIAKSENSSVKKGLSKQHGHCPFEVLNHFIIHSV